MENFTDTSSSANSNLHDKKQAYANEKSHILGWGIDANPKNDPTFPMRNRSNETTKNFDWPRPTLQEETTEILHSNERPNLTATFGTASPPSGLSGIIRRFAFRYSEGKMAHWLALLLADRVNVVEGIASDVAKGHVPNVFKESGICAQWKHNPDAVVKKAVVGVAVVSSIIILLRLKRR